MKKRNKKKRAEHFSRELPAGFQCDNIGTCGYAVYLITENNVKRGYKKFKVFDGYVTYVDVTGLNRCHCHRWIVLENGDIYDPSRGQFFNKCPWHETPAADFEYVPQYEYTPGALMDYGCDITAEFKAWHYKETTRGEFFKGAMWQPELRDPSLIPPHCRV